MLSKFLGNKTLPGDQIIENLMKNNNVYLEKQFGDDYVFRIK